MLAWLWMWIGQARGWRRKRSDARHISEGNRKVARELTRSEGRRAVVARNGNAAGGAPWILAGLAPRDGPPRSNLWTILKQISVGPRCKIEIERAWIIIAQ